jgi:hypothetical protein
MSTVNVLKRWALGSTLDLTTQSETPQYKLGEVVAVNNDSQKCTNKYMYVRSHEALVAGRAYMISYSSTAGTEVVTAKAATSSVLIIPCVAVCATTPTYYCWVQIEGLTTVLCESGSETIGHVGKLVNNKYTVTTGGNTTWAATTIGYFVATGATAGSSFYLIGQNNRVSI